MSSSGAISCPNKKEGGKLTVSLWLGRDRRIISDPLPLTSREFA